MKMKIFGEPVGQLRSSVAMFVPALQVTV